MNQLKKFDRARIRDAALAVSPIFFLLIIATFLAYKYVDPAPPKRVVLSAGEKDGNYYAAAKKYQEIVKAEGIDLEVLESKGAWENLHRLEDAKSDVQVGFVQDGLGTRKNNPDVSSLGSLFYEPIWIFYRGSKDIKRLTALKGQRIAVGEKGGETHTMAAKMLTVSGVTEGNSHFETMSQIDARQALLDGKVDAAFFIAAGDNELILDLIKDSHIHLVSLDQAEAFTRKFPYLHHLVLPHGAIDLEKNLPFRDIDLVAPTATLVARNSLHPALVYLLMKAAGKVHHQPGLFEKKNEFPIDKDFIFPINPGAKEYFRTGAPFWIKYLPFWLAILMERFLFLVLPTMALIIPMIKMVPRFLNWRVRSRLYRGYGELKMLEDRIDGKASAEQIRTYVSQLDAIEDQVNGMSFPIDVFDDVYLLREHIHFVRERINRLTQRNLSQA